MQGRKCARKGETKRTKRTKQSGDEDASMAIASGSPASCCTSDSESNASLESADANARPKGKARAGRGATTEPQSIYARVLLYMIILFCLFMKVAPLSNWIWQYCCCSLVMQKRRERINERLKILQNLVPNGTKVDISTMLEEAVHYVKFLQLQIRVRICRVWFSWHHPYCWPTTFRWHFPSLNLQLLSSDDMWMYAPIAYNGMNIGIDLNMDRWSKREPWWRNFLYSSRTIGTEADC